MVIGIVEKRLLPKRGNMSILTSIIICSRRYIPHCKDGDRCNRCRQVWMRSPECREDFGPISLVSKSDRSDRFIVCQVSHPTFSIKSWNTGSFLWVVISWNLSNDVESDQGESSPVKQYSRAYLYHLHEAMLNHGKSWCLSALDFRNADIWKVHELLGTMLLAEHNLNLLLDLKKGTGWNFAYNCISLFRSVDGWMTERKWQGYSRTSEQMRETCTMLSPNMSY